MNNHLEAARIMMKRNGGGKSGITLNATNDNWDYVPPTDKLYNKANVNVPKTLQQQIPIIVNNKLNTSYFTSMYGHNIGTDWLMVVYREVSQNPYGQIGTIMYGFGNADAEDSAMPINGGLDMVIDPSSTVDNVKGQINNFYIYGSLFIELYYIGSDYGYSTTTPVAIYQMYDSNNLWYTTYPIGTKREKRDITGYIDAAASIIGSGSYSFQNTGAVFHSRKGASSQPFIGGYEFTFDIYTNWYTKEFVYGPYTYNDYIDTWNNNIRNTYGYHIGGTDSQQRPYSFFNYSDTLFWTNPNYYYPTVLKRLMLHIYTLQEEGEI